MVKSGISCYGCGVCATVCKRRAVRIILSQDGFFVPNVDEKKCIKCKRCEQNCSFSGDMISKQNIKIEEAAYSVVTKDEETLVNVTSGGAAFELGKVCLQTGYSVIGCAYDYDRQRAVHIIADNEEELKSTRGSKYIQSWTSDVLKSIDVGKKYAVFGTPCQISSFRRFAENGGCENNWIFIDFFCHGVPSYHLWNKYVDYRISRQKAKLASVKFRDKRNGWGIYTMTMTMTNGKFYSRSVNKNDIFLNMFLGNYVLNKPCYSCKFHGLKSSADIRVGDFWSRKYKNNKIGVSSVIVFTESGKNLLRSIEDKCSITKETVELVLERQIIKDLQVPKNREKIINELKKTTGSLAIIYIMYCVKQWSKSCIPGFFKDIVRSILRLK
jgi:coenzyme F420-reducing hydrogenase beta subunit